MDETTATWSSGEQPWIRRELPAGPAAASAGEGAQCYFCGQHTVKLSRFGDVADDTGRVRVYCDNPACAAREVSVLVERDGGSASRRADVRVLRRLDCEDVVGDVQVYGTGLVTRSAHTPDPDAALQRRRSGEPFTLDVP